MRALEGTVDASGGIHSLPSEPCAAPGFPDIAVITRGRVSESETSRAVLAIGRVLERRGVVGGARLRLTGPHCERGPTVVQVNFRVSDLPARMQAVMSGERGLLTAIARLNRQIDWVAAPWRPRPWPDSNRRVLFARSDSVILRRKQVALQCTTPLHAAVVMDAMDYDVHLFADAETGEDAVVYRAGPTGLRLARQRRMHPSESGLTGAQLVVNPRRTSVLTEGAAVDRLREYGLPFLFFTDSESGRGRLLYPRYDGDLSLVAPVEDGDR